MLGTQPPTLDELRQRYAALSAEEFALVRREDLTPDGQRAFDAEVMKRGEMPEDVAPRLNAGGFAASQPASDSEEVGASAGVLGTSMPTVESLRIRYAAMSDEAFALVLREDLTSVGQQAFDSEMRRRGIEPPPVPELTEEEQVEAVYVFAAEQLANGLSASEVISRLVARGIEADSATSLVSELRQARNDAAETNMRQGTLWVLGGIFVTVVTYAAASDGRRYFLAWGAILFGAIKFFRGWADKDKN